MSRPPTPVAIHKLRGTFRRDRHGGEEPQPTAGLPVAPDHLDAQAADEYYRTGKLLADCRVLTQADKAALACYAAAWSRLIEAETKLRETGLIVKSPSGFPCISPYLSIVNRAAEEIRKWSGELGLTPSARSKLKITPAETPSGDGEKYFKLA